MTETTTETRVLPLEGVNNFRDYGGYAVAGGGQVKRDLLWRSAQHGDATDADLAAISALDLANVVDLRGPSEREAKPCRRAPDFAAQLWTYPEETAGLALHTEAADGVITAAEARAAMIRLYEGIAFRPNLVPMLKCYLTVLDRAEGPSLVHCVAGKDRTGFAVALVQRLLGVHADDVMADYLLTNSAGRIEERIAAGVFRTMERYASHDADTVRALWGVEESYLATTFAVIAERHGTIEAYAEAVLGVDAAVHERLKSAYVS
jgi:protein tyrosine/serine phosphatase